VSGITLANESALGVYRFTWAYDGGRAGVLWYEGGGAPLTELNGNVREVARPERFGWPATLPPAGKRQLAMVRQFAQKFADALAADDDG
jgi:hypothetical protein